MNDLPPPPPSSGRPPGPPGGGPLIGLPNDADLRRRADQNQWEEAAQRLEDPQLEPEGTAPANLEPVDHTVPLEPQEQSDPEADFQHADIPDGGVSLQLEGPSARKNPPQGDLPAPAEPTALGPTSSRAISPSPGPPGRRVGLFGPDIVTNIIVGLAIGLLVGIVPAIRTAQGLSRSTVDPLLDELEQSIDRPLAVEADELRAPRAIQAEIEERGRDARGRYFLVWLAVAVPVGGALGLIRRRVS